MKETTLGELGAILPIGVVNKVKKNFSFKNWGLEQEKEISAMKRKTTFMGEFVNKVLCYMIQELAGDEFDNLDNDTKLLTVNQMKMMDVLYVYLYLRYDQLDEHVRMDIGCPTCGKINKDFIADMNGLDIGVVEIDPGGKVKEKGKVYDSEYGEYKLRKPFKIKDTLVESLKIARTPWDAMRLADDEVTANQGKLMEVIFKHSIIGINSDDPNPSVDIDAINANLHKSDFERLSNKITKHNGGPSLRVSGKCYYCASTFFKQLDWSYESFFGSSSLPLD